MRRLLLSYLFFTVLLAALSGCGQKGPLYLPVPPAPQQNTAAPSSASPEPALSPAGAQP